ncbi:ABC transporter ATP-binding protein [Haladaptatus caseinilyticus]|uniref:ABC transporter ATP-binding protein n=1 Tax=Haladaptatus caseinilyticus TaxID=2993314 RepID=UPI00224B5391|nr:ABC transporter ATP-binding protein [Haladaptatus caseinilyticus]
MIEVDNIRAGYVPGIDIINGLSATFGSNQISSIIGPNGAGKSTLLKSIYGFVNPHQGKIRYDGTDITQTNPTEMITEMGFAYIPQERSVFPDLTVRENLELGAWTIRKNSQRVEKAIEDVFDEFPALGEKRSERAGTMSGGQQRMLEIGRSLVTDPDVVFIDEPSVGLAPRLAADVYESIEQLRDRGVTILLVDQNVRAAVEYGDSLFVLERGRVEVQGDANEMDDEISELISSWISTEATV